MSLRLEHLRLFHAVAEKKSVTRAAEMLAISQPAVSKQLKLLEKGAGVRLIERSGRGISLTREGEVLADYVRRIFSLVTEAESALADLQGLRNGHVAIGAGTTVGVYALPEAIVRFRQRFPAIALRTEVGASHLLRQRLREGSIEIAITEASLPSPEFVSEVFASDELVGIVPMDHKLARKASVSASAFSKQPFVAREAASGTQTLVERVFRERGLRVTPVITLSSTEAVKRAVSAGLGVSIVSKMSLGFEIEAKKLAMLKLTDVPLRRPIYVVRLRSRRESRAVTAFLCMLKHVIRGTPPKLNESCSVENPTPPHPGS
jgi:DNA-binding transcriptional LysR family regulator